MFKEAKKIKHEMKINVNFKSLMQEKQLSAQQKNRSPVQIHTALIKNSTVYIF